MDLQTLHDAFAELERRADAQPLRLFVVPETQRPPFLLIGASAAAVLVVASGVAALTASSGDRAADRTGSPVSPAPTGPVRGSAASSPLPSSAPTSAPMSVPTAAPSAPAGLAPVASTEADIEQRFTAALARLATSFTVTDTGHAVTVQVPSTPASTAPAAGPTTTPSGPATDPGVNGVAIVGELTAADGVVGGYDVQMFQSTRGTTASCDDPDRAVCTVTHLDGGTVALGHEALQSGGVTYQCEYVRADGVTILMHVSDRADPKGAGGRLAVAPPLTLAQLRSVVTSDAW